MSDGKCPKCGSPDYFASKDGPGIADDHLGWGMLTARSATYTTTGRTLLCTACGYWESYVTDKALLAEIFSLDGGTRWSRIVPADWKPDPTGRHELRYWDGIAWTSSVSDDGAVSEDAIEPEA
jgi:predicted nucleic-acid-binding Zn-ribbon protein